MEPNHKPMPTYPFAPETTDGYWRTLTTNANALFRQDRFEEAEPLYKDAFLDAEDIFRSAQAGTVYPDAAPAPLLLTSAMNLAENYARKGEGSNAYKTLSRMLECLCTALHDPSTPQKFLEQCACQLAQGVSSLTSIMRTLGASNETIALEIETAKKAFLTFSSRQITQH